MLCTLLLDVNLVFVSFQHQGAESGPQQQSGVSGEAEGGSAGPTGFSGESAPAGRRQVKDPAGSGPVPNAHAAERGTAACLRRFIVVAGCGSGAGLGGVSRSSVCRVSGIGL